MIEVELLHITPLEVLVKAIRCCYDSQYRSDSRYIDGIYKLGIKDRELIGKIIDSAHHSCLEHITLNYHLKGYSRALLQEKSRHRISSVSEKSTRFCLGKLKKENPFIVDNIVNYEKAKEYLVFTGIQQVDDYSIKALEALRECIASGISNDKAKYCLPDSLKSEGYFTINVRSLRNFFELRTNSDALWEIQDLSKLMYKAIPDEYKFLFTRLYK